MVIHDCVFSSQISLVCGDTENGVWNTDDFLARLVKGCIQLEASPFLIPTDAKDLPKIDMSPVDYVSNVIVNVVLMNRWSDEYPRNFNVVNPSPFPYYKLFEVVKSYGYKLTHLPYPTWRQKFLESVQQSSHDDIRKNPLFPVASQFTESWIEHLSNPIYSNINVESTIGTELTFPDLERLINLYLSYFNQCNFIPSPEVPTSGQIVSGRVHMLCRTNRN